MSGEGRDEGVVFLVESPHRWRGVWQRPHQFFSRLARHFQVYYVNPQYLKNVIRDFRSYWQERSLKVDERLNCLSPLLFNGERFPLVLKYNRAKVKKLCEELAARHQHEHLILWLYDPHHSYLAQQLKYDKLVYDIMDEYQGFPWSPPRIAEEEQELLERADLVLAGTGKLYEAKRSHARTIHCLLSAVEFEHFHRATRAGQLPAELKRIKEKYRYVAGYFGTLDMRINQGMLAKAMSQLPEWALVLIGPKVSNFSLLEALPNVFLLGQRPYSTLPDFTRGFDVCLIPFELDLLTEHVNPTKVLEYFAAGKPVVSTSIPDLKQFYPELVSFADSSDELVRALPEVLSSPSRGELREKGLALAAENTWDEAVKKILRFLDLPQQESGG